MFRFSSRHFVTTAVVALSTLSVHPTEGLCLDGKSSRGNAGRATLGFATSEDPYQHVATRISSSSPLSQSRRRHTRSAPAASCALSSSARGGRSIGSPRRSAATSGRCSGISPAGASRKTAPCGSHASTPLFSTAIACSSSSSCTRPGRGASGGGNAGASSGARENSAFGRLLSPQVFPQGRQRKSLESHILYALRAFGLEKRALRPALQPTSVTSSTSTGHVGVRVHRGSDTGGLPTVGLGEGVRDHTRPQKQTFRAKSLARPNGENCVEPTEPSGSRCIAHRRAS